MPKVTYVAPDGSRITLDVAEGRNVMQGAVDHGLDGIVGECGGNAMCATCHVYVDAPSLPPITEHEAALLEGTASERRANSRLSCQLPAIEGLVVELPDRQT